MKPTQWGIIGPGKIAHSFAKDLLLLPLAQEIKAVLGSHEDTTEKFAKEFKVPLSYTDLNEFVKNSGVDVVYIATPNTEHIKEALACLENKIPVLCEKPMTINADQCKELIQASRKNRTFLMEGMWIRFLPSIQMVLQMIQEDRIGNILSVKASVGYKAPHNSDSRYFNPALGGGSLLDLGIYPVFLAYMLMGKPHTIKSIGTLSTEGVDETCSVLFHYKGGQHAVLESSLLASSDTAAEIIGEKGVIKILDPWYEKASGIELHVYDDGKIVYPCQWAGHGLQYETQEILRCIAHQKIESDILSHSFSLDMIEIMDEIRNQIHVTYDMYE